MGKSMSSANALDGLLSTFGPIPKGPRRRNFTLRVPELSLEESKHWEQRLKRHYFSCGCLEGSVATIVALVGFLFYLLFRPSGFSLAWLDGAHALGLFILAGLIGKILGLRGSRKRLQQTISDLKCLLQERADTSGGLRGDT